MAERGSEKDAEKDRKMHVKNSGIGLNRWWTLASCNLSCFIAWLDYMIVNTALPAIEKDLSASLLQLQWVMNAFLLCIVIFIITLGRIADLWGRRMINILGVLLFGIACLLAGMSTSPGFLIFCRALQGIASAAIIPSSLALISHAFTPEEKGKAIGIWSSVTGLGMALGPVLGGILVSTLSWRWIFFINIPFAILSIAISLFKVQESQSDAKARALDWKGLGLMTLGLSCLTISLTHAPDWGWASFKTLFLIMGALAVLFWFYFYEKKSSCPTIPCELLANRTFFSSIFTMSGVVFIYAASFFFLPLYLINILHQEPYIAGLLILPYAGSVALLSPFTGHLSDKISPKKIILFGLFLYGLGLAMQFAFGEKNPLLLVIASMLLMGIGWAIARPAITTTAIVSAPSHFAGTATGVLWSVQNTGGTLGIAIAVTIFRQIYDAAHTTAAFFSGYQIGLWFLMAVFILTFFTVAYGLKSR